MVEFVHRLKIHPGLHIVDLGGSPALWNLIPGKLQITIINLPGAVAPGSPSHHELKYIEADACDLSFLADSSFDIVFSNSVIEHVGDEARQEAFAREVRRLGRAYWVQTPSIWFPIEAHTGMPFWWHFPDKVRARLIARWKETLPAWAEFIEDTRVLTKARMLKLFPDAKIYKETLAGLQKSITAYRNLEPVEE